VERPWQVPGKPQAAALAFAASPRVPLARWAKHTVTPADDLVQKHLARPARWLLPAIAVEWILPALSLPDALDQRARHAMVIAIIVGTGWVVFAALRVGLIDRPFR